MSLENPHDAIARAAAQRQAAELQRIPETLRPLLDTLPEGARWQLVSVLSDLVCRLVPEPFERRRGLALGMLYAAKVRRELSVPATDALLRYVLEIEA